MPDAGQPVEHLALKKGQAFLDGAREFELNWLHTCQSRGIWRLWWLIYCNLLGIDSTTGAYNSNAELQFAGSQDQYAVFRVQLARRFLHQRKMMAQDQRPNLVGVARTNDVAAMAEAKVATKAVDYLLTEAKLEQRASESLTSLVNFGMGGLMSGWDYDGGDQVEAIEPQRDENGDPVSMPELDEQGAPILEPHPETGELVEKTRPVMTKVMKPSGAPTIRKFYPWQMVYDPYIEDDHPDVTVKIPVNKYELAAQFREKYDDIIKLGIDDELGDDALFAWGGSNAVSSDIVVLRMYFHRSCKAVPGGRWAGYVKNIGLWGVDDIMPCPLKKGIPVKVMAGPRYFGTGFGYPESGDLLSLQTVMNEIYSMFVTNIQKRGNANAYIRDDVQIDVEKWSRGGYLHPIPAGAEPPAWDEPPSMDAVSQYMMESLQEQARLMFGSNSVVEGNPDANISSGAFAVLLVNIAQKYVSDIQEAHDNAFLECANDCLELARTNAENGFWAEVAGIGDAPYVQIITKDKLSSLKRIKLERQSPVLGTFVGRTEVFDRTIGLPKRERQDAMDMLLTGRTDSFAERDQASKIRIRKENEMLLQGVIPVCTIWDDHALEGPDHLQVYNGLRSMDPPTDPEAYASWQAACQACEAHLQAHSLALATASPPIAMVAGWAPLQASAPGGGPADQQPQEQGPGGGKQDKAGPNGGSQMAKPPGPPKPPSAPKGAGGVASNV